MLLFCHTHGDPCGAAVSGAGSVRWRLWGHRCRQGRTVWRLAEAGSSSICYLSVREDGQGLTLLLMVQGSTGCIGARQAGSRGPGRGRDQPLLSGTRSGKGPGEGGGGSRAAAGALPQAPSAVTGVEDVSARVEDNLKDRCTSSCSPRAARDQLLRAEETGGFCR